MAAVSPDALIARLMEVHDASSREQLARKLDVPLRSLQRWATGEGIAFSTAVDLFQQAGWLAVNADGADHLAAHARARKVASRLANDFEELVSALEQSEVPEGE